MELKIRYENEMQTIELDSAATDQLWVSLSLEGEGLSQEEREKRIQEEWDKQYNRPEYNVWHRETRQGDPDDAAFDIMDYLLTTNDIEMHDHNFEYQDVCAWVRKVLAKKPEWADAFIAIRLDGESVREYAARIGADENNISQKLKRAEKKLKENYKDRQI